MRYFKKLEAKRLYLSPINPDDVDIYAKWINDLTLSSRIGSASQLYSLPKEQAVLDHMAKEGNNFAIVLKDTDELLGNCSLFAIHPIHRTAELGIFLGDSNHRNKGYGTEAIQLLTEYGFKVLNLHSIMLRFFDFNHSASRCYEKAGFRVFGKRSESYFLNGHYYDEVYMELLSNEAKSNYLDLFLPSNQE